MWSGGKHKSHAPLYLQEVRFGWPKAHCNAATDGWSNSEKPIGILQDVLLKVELFIFPADFVIIDCEVDFEVHIILWSQFFATGRALVDMEKRQMKF